MAQNIYKQKYGHLRSKGGKGGTAYGRRLNDTLTPAEAALHRELDRRRIPHDMNYVISCSHSMTGFYVVDCRIPSARLLIELDGEPHVGEKAQWKDKLRTEAILAKHPGWQLVRAWNSEIADVEAWVDEHVAPLIEIEKSKLESRRRSKRRRRHSGQRSVAGPKFTSFTDDEWMQLFTFVRDAGRMPSARWNAPKGEGKVHQLAMRAQGLAGQLVSRQQTRLSHLPGWEWRKLKSGEEFRPEPYVPPRKHGNRR